MSVDEEEIRIRGERQVGARRAGRRSNDMIGGLVRVARIKDEELVEGELFEDPDAFLSRLRRSGLPADVFTFPISSELSSVSPQRTASAVQNSHSAPACLWRRRDA